MKETRVEVRLAAKLLREVKTVAKNRKLSLSELIRALLEKAVEEEYAKQGLQITEDAEQV